MTDTRWHFGGPYGYEFDCQIIPPVAAGLASRLEAQAAAFLGQLETYRRLSNLPTLTNYAKDAAGNAYEYGVVMGRPYAVIHVAPVGAPEITGNPYQPAIAYLFPVSSSGIGNTIHYSSPAWSYVKHPDNRATTHEKFYGRPYGGMADATMYDTRLLHYKGGGFLLGDNSSYDAAGVVNDPTARDTVSRQTAGRIVALRDLATQQWVWVGNLPPADKWKTFSSYDAAGYPEVPMSFQGVISADSVINFCYDKPYVCTFRNNAGVSTIESFRLAAEGASPALSLVSSVAAASADTVDLRPYVTVSTTAGPAFAMPYSEYSVSAAPFDTGSAIVSTDYNNLGTDSNGVTVEYTLSFSESKDIADFATSCHSYASSLSSSLPQVSGTVTRSCTASTLFKVAEYATNYEVIRHEDFYSPDNPPSDTSHNEWAEYTKLTEASTFSASYAFSGTVGGIAYTLSGSEALTRSRAIEASRYQTSVSDNGAGGIDSVWLGPDPRDEHHAKTTTYDSSFDVARCLFSDARFGSSVVLESTTTVDVDVVAATNQTSTGSNFLTGTAGVSHVTPYEDYISLWVSIIQPNSAHSSADFPYTTQTKVVHTEQYLVLHYGGVEAHRHKFYDKTVSSRSEEHTSELQSPLN